MDDRRMVGKNRGGALQQAEWRQRLVIRGIAVEIAIIGRCGHGWAPQAISAHHSRPGRANEARFVCESSTEKRHARFR